MSEIVIKLPDKTTPGYLRRQMDADRFRQELGKNKGQEYWDTLVDFLLVFVIEPEDRQEARDLLLDATEEQYHQMLDVIHGRKKEENPTQAQTSETS